jgi:hypothetical protein
MTAWAVYAAVCLCAMFLLCAVFARGPALVIPLVTASRGNADTTLATAAAPVCAAGQG